MFCCLKVDFSITIPNYRVRGSSSRVCSSSIRSSLQFQESYLTKGVLPKTLDSVNLSKKSLKWWEKSAEVNMIEIHSAQELVDSLLNAGENLVVIDFYAPGCGGCKALHPKICQLAESNRNTVFLKVNYEQHKAMCYALHVHVLPFFRFYRGAEGKVCSFSCTNATINKFKGALSKYGTGTEQCSLGCSKGLEENEILALSSIGLINEELLPSNVGVKQGVAMAMV